MELWRSVIERYPRSKVRFDAHMKLGEHHLAVLADHAKAKIHFEAVYSEENRNEDQRALALLKTGAYANFRQDNMPNASRCFDRSSRTTRFRNT